MPPWPTDQTPWPRAGQRGLEAIEELREQGVKITFVQGEVPGAAAIEEKVAILAERLNARVITCSAEFSRHLEEAGGRVLDLRRLANELSPDHVPGEHLKVDLVRAGRQPAQAVGFLPAGDMVVVNDAEELVGQSRRGDRRVVDPAHKPGPARVRTCSGRGPF